MQQRIVASLVAVADNFPRFLTSRTTLFFAASFRSSQLYWLDHNTKSTQLFPPEALPPDEFDVGAGSLGMRVESLPEYKHTLRTLVSRSERHERAKKEVRSGGRADKYARTWKYDVHRSYATNVSSLTRRCRFLIAARELPPRNRPAGQEHTDAGGGERPRAGPDRLRDAL